MITAALVLYPHTGLLASPSSSTLQEKRAQAGQVEAQVQAIDAELEVAVEQFNHANYTLGRTQAEIAAARAKLAQAEADLAQAQDALNARVTGMYKGGQASFVEVLLATRTFSEFVSGWHLLQEVSERDAQLAARIRRDKRIIEKQESILAERERAQAQTAGALSAKKSEVQKRLAERQRYFDSVRSEIAAIETRQRAAAAAAAARVVRARTAKATFASIPLNGAGRTRVVQIALAQLGKPYVWAAAGPNAFDCSGLTMYVYAQVGVSLPHSAEAQYGIGQRVGRNQLQPGDLVFFSADGSYISHVGLYAGSNSYIAAPQTGSVVSVRSMNRGGYVGATRP